MVIATQTGYTTPFPHVTVPVTRQQIVIHWLHGVDKQLLVLSVFSHTVTGKSSLISDELNLNFAELAIVLPAKQFQIHNLRGWDNDYEIWIKLEYLFEKFYSKILEYKLLFYLAFG